MCFYVVLIEFFERIDKANNEKSTEVNLACLGKIGDHSVSSSLF